MKKIIMLGLIISNIITLLFMSCSKDSLINSDYKQSNILVPLAIGNYWEYETENKSKRTDSICEKKIIADQEVYFLETDYGSWKGKQALCNINNGYLITLYWQISFTNPKYYFKYPVEVNDRWENISYIYVNGIITTTDKYRCIAKDKKIKVPAGTFRCYLYEIQRKTHYSLDDSKKYYQD